VIKSFCIKLQTLDYITKITLVQIQYRPKQLYKIKFIQKHICQTLTQTYTKQANSLIFLNPTNLPNIGGESHLSENEVNSPPIPSSSYPSKTINQRTKFKVIPFIPSLPHPIPHISPKQILSNDPYLLIVDDNLAFSITHSRIIL